MHTAAFTYQNGFSGFRDKAVKKIKKEIFSIENIT